MTQIVAEVRNKKELREQAEKLNNNALAETTALIHDPSPFHPMRDGKWIKLHDVREGEEWLVTNHPKRSWFARIVRIGNRLVVT